MKTRPNFLRLAAKYGRPIGDEFLDSLQYTEGPSSGRAMLNGREMIGGDKYPFALRNPHSDTSVRPTLTVTRFVDPTATGTRLWPQHHLSPVVPGRAVTEVFFSEIFSSCPECNSDDCQGFPRVATGRKQTTYRREPCIAVLQQPSKEIGRKPNSDERSSPPHTRPPLYPSRTYLSLLLPASWLPTHLPSQSFPKIPLQPPHPFPYRPTPNIVGRAQNSEYSLPAASVKYCTANPAAVGGKEGLGRDFMTTTNVTHVSQVQGWENGRRGWRPGQQLFFQPMEDWEDELPVHMMHNRSAQWTFGVERPTAVHLHTASPKARTLRRVRTTRQVHYGAPYRCGGWRSSSRAPVPVARAPGPPDRLRSASVSAPYQAPRSSSSETSQDPPHRAPLMRSSPKSLRALRGLSRLPKLGGSHRCTRRIQPPLFAISSASSALSPRYEKSSHATKRARNMRPVPAQRQSKPKQQLRHCERYVSRRETQLPSPPRLRVCGTVEWVVHSSSESASHSSILDAAFFLDRILDNRLELNFNAPPSHHDSLHTVLAPSSLYLHPRSPPSPRSANSDSDPRYIAVIPETNLLSRASAACSSRHPLAFFHHPYDSQALNFIACRRPSLPRPLMSHSPLLSSSHWLIFSTSDIRFATPFLQGPRGQRAALRFHRPPTSTCRLTLARAGDPGSGHPTRQRASHMDTPTASTQRAPAPTATMIPATSSLLIAPNRSSPMSASPGAHALRIRIHPLLNVVPMRNLQLRCAAPPPYLERNATSSRSSAHRALFIRALEQYGELCVGVGLEFQHASYALALPANAVYMSSAAEQSPHSDKTMSVIQLPHYNAETASRPRRKHYGSRTVYKPPRRNDGFQPCTIPFLPSDNFYNHDYHSWSTRGEYFIFECYENYGFPEIRLYTEETAAVEGMHKKFYDLGYRATAVIKENIYAVDEWLNTHCRTVCPYHGPWRPEASDEPDDTLSEIDINGMPPKTLVHEGARVQKLRRDFLTLQRPLFAARRGDGSEMQNWECLLDSLFSTSEAITADPMSEFAR
ncbi:hypothetical protein B0H11DRAFT_1919803 [Mycena galericulata]|nr:hypothetical protein B0H11DRAFT_1919803 [Mycena galericulata]